MEDIFSELLSLLGQYYAWIKSLINNETIKLAIK